MDFQQLEHSSNIIQMFPMTEGKGLVEKVEENSVSRFIGTVLLKPTYACNADCDYCCAPPEDNNKWTVERFKLMFDRLEPVLRHNCTFIWHGGEPMLMSPQFYEECCEHVLSKLKNPEFAMQSNLTKYSRSKWKPLLEKYFDSSISSSFDADEYHRTINGDPVRYSQRFKKSFSEVVEDGFDCGLITVLDKTNSHTVDKFIDFGAKAAKNGNMIGISINRMEAAGRKKDDGSLLTNKEYAEILIHALERWRREELDLKIEPLASLLSAYVNGSTVMRCGNNHSCARGMMMLDWDGTVSTCDDLKYMSANPKEYAYGNILEDSLFDIISSPSFKKIASRIYNIPMECHECEAFSMCKGGCPVYVLKNNNNISDKDPRCEQFQMIFKHIKKLEGTGELGWYDKYLNN
ncbi:radical SAM/SPASM domain-containing protein [Photobacterium damselae]|uniref:radical SAM/SPASM domain-containing protein n=1 Tax=Photobacterium damselae TaxID=38293 RepID=UPI001F3075F7|nr:radical SAM protein [Photobacterium damselae]UKA04686.1 radical SAM protein [Photobacterium damselae subsp. damselae]